MIGSSTVVLQVTASFQLRVLLVKTFVLQIESTLGGWSRPSCGCAEGPIGATADRVPSEPGVTGYGLTTAIHIGSVRARTAAIASGASRSANR